MYQNVPQIHGPFGAQLEEFPHPSFGEQERGCVDHDPGAMPTPIVVTAARNLAVRRASTEQRSDEKQRIETSPLQRETEHEAGDDRAPVWPRRTGRTP
jgi:hypothetical protein